ncbi:hypothetical protein GWI33_009336, partial [Rhynchophorus ferrugineus]
SRRGCWLIGPSPYIKSKTTAINFNQRRPEQQHTVPLAIQLSDFLSAPRRQRLSEPKKTHYTVFIHDYMAWRITTPFKK